jgi:thiol-disulfide isomerase/thioredoxin
MKRKNLLFASIAILFAVIGGYFGIIKIDAEKQKALAVTTLFAQSMADDKARVQDLSQWKGKILIVNFWATWCAPCIEEMPDLSVLQTQIAQKNAQIIGIGIDSAANISEYSSKYKINYPLYVGGMNGTELSRQFGDEAGGLPFTVLIGSDGQVKKTYLGRLKLDELRKELASF